MLHATRRRTPPLSAALATAFFASKPQPPPLVSPRLVDAAVSRCPSDALALSFFLWCARRPAYLHPPASFDRILPAATRLASRLRTAPALLRELRAVGCPIRPHTFLLLLRLYWRGGLYPLVLQLFDQMPLWGFQPNVFALNVALDVHLRTGRLDAALRLLRERDKPSPNYLTYAIFVTHLSRAGDWSGVRNCFISMLQQGFLPSAASLASVFTCCSKAGTMSELLQLLSFTLVSGNQLNSAMWTCFIARICREGRLDEACRMLAKMLNSGSSPTVVTYTPLVKGLFRAGRHDKVHELLGSMASTGCSPDLVFYNVLMDCMMKERRYDYALYIYLNLHRHGIKPDAYTLSTLVQVLQLSHNMVLLPRLILGTGISYDLVACNSMLSALCKSGFPSEAIQFYIDMVDVGFRPDSYSYVRCLDSLCQLGRIDHAKSFYYSIVDPNTYVHASILRGLVRSGKNRMALKIFREAVRQNCALDAVCYTIVLHGLFQAHLVEEACKLFDKMKLLGMASNTCIYNVMLRGLCRTRDMHAVTQLLGEMESAGVQMDSISFNILVVLLIKLQRISSATTLVREMLNLGMKLSTKTHWLLSQSIGHAFIVEDATISESDASDSTSDLLASGAWLLYKSNTREENFLFATLKGFSVLDDREGTQDELRLAIGKSATVRDTSSVDGYDNPNELDSGELRIQKDLGIEPIPSMLILDAILRKTSSSVSLCVQRPKFLVALDFLLAIVEFFVPSARSLLSNDEDKDLLHMISPVVFHDQLYHQEQSTFSLSPQNPLIVDNEKFDHFIYDGKGGKLYLQDREGKILSCPSAESFIHVLGGKSLQFRNVTIVNGEYLDSCISLGSDCWYSASEDDHVYLVRENDGLPSTLNEEIAEDVVENASADRSTEFIMELQAIGPELTFYSTSRNAGENLALSTKVIHARTDVFCSTLSAIKSIYPVWVFFWKEHPLGEVLAEIDTILFTCRWSLVMQRHRGICAI